MGNNGQDSLSVHRRSFLRRLILWPLAAAGLMWAWGIGRFALFQQGRVGPRDLPGDALKSLVQGRPVHVTAARAWILKPGRVDEIIAFDDRCTHLGCRPVWDRAGGLFRCPCHGSEFDKQGGVIRGPATKPMTPLFVSEESGKLRLVSKPRTDPRSW